MEGAAADVQSVSARLKPSDAPRAGGALQALQSWLSAPVLCATLIEIWLRGWEARRGNSLPQCLYEDSSLWELAGDGGEFDGGAMGKSDLGAPPGYECDLCCWDIEEVYDESE